MSTYLNWNNTIEYIKSELGAEVNQLEIDEYRMQEIILNKTMPVFCSYVNYEDYIMPDKLIPIDDPARPAALIEGYDRTIFEIKDVYMPRTLAIAYTIPYSASEATDLAIANYDTTIAQSMVPIRSWSFVRPNKLYIHTPLSLQTIDFNSTILKVGAEFLSPNEIEPSMYIQFRKLATADVIDHIIDLRTKYQSLTTPQGQINFNLDRLMQKAEKYRQEALNVLEEQTIPDHFLWWINP